MREIAILSRAGVDIGVELFDAVTWLRNVGIYPRNAAILKECGVLSVDDEEIRISVNVLRHHGFEAAHVTETDDYAYGIHGTVRAEFAPPNRTGKPRRVSQ